MILIKADYNIAQKKYERAFKYYKLASDKGCGDAMYEIGRYYNNIAKNYKESKKYYKMAVDNGNIDALYNLGNYYYKINKNYTKAIKYYKMSISNGNVDALNNLGILYESLHDTKKAIEYYKKSAHAGNSYAMNNLALLYEQKNYAVAVEYYKMSIYKGCAKAVYNLISLFDSKNKYQENAECFLEYLNRMKKNKKIINKIKNYLEYLIKKVNYDTKITICEKINLDVEDYINPYLLYNKNSNFVFQKEENKTKINIYIQKQRIQDFCCICLDTVNCIKTECNHLICTECYPFIIEQLKCPLCRSIISH